MLVGLFVVDVPHYYSTALCSHALRSIAKFLFYCKVSTVLFKVLFSPLFFVSQQKEIPSFLFFRRSSVE